MVNFTRRQWLTLIVIGVADFCNAICVSLQAPFYPQEVSIGIVISVFDLINAVTTMETIIQNLFVQFEKIFLLNIYDGLNLREIRF